MGREGAKKRDHLSRLRGRSPRGLQSSYGLRKRRGGGIRAPDAPLPRSSKALVGSTTRVWS